MKFSKKTVFDKLVTLILGDLYNTDKSDLEKKSDALVKNKTDYNATITEIEGKIPSISGLATDAALIAVENKIPHVSNLVKKYDDAEILDIKSKHFTTADYYRFTNFFNSVV